jgi:hypothetical protein
MLTRIETAYLAILRIVVLVVATVALLVALLSFIAAVPPLARQFGLVPAATPEGGTLAEYINARKATVPSNAGASSPSGAPAQPVRTTNDDIRTAAGTLQIYTNGANSLTAVDWERQIEQSGSSFPDELQNAYYKDVLSLAEQLRKSTGKRLSVSDVRDLLAWNAQQFQSDETAKSLKKSSDTTRAIFTLYVASGAFVLFILVVFTFLFVKVERSLRVVRTVRLEEQNA